MARMRSCLSMMTIARKLCLNALPDLRIEDGRVPSRMASALVRDLADVDGVAQNAIQMAPTEWAAADCVGSASAARGRSPAAPINLAFETTYTAECAIQRKDLPHPRSLHFVDDQTLLVRNVADRRDPAHPHSLAFRGGDLVADALSGDLALELRERQQHVQRQAAHRAGRVELLRDRHER